MLASSTARSGFAGQGPITSKIGKSIGIASVRAVVTSGHRFLVLFPLHRKKPAK
jgi:hypothetical protein